jgi:hypothetical protein
MNKYQIFTMLALALPGMAQAASVTKPIVACKAEPDAKKLLEFIANNNNSGLDKFRMFKVKTGDCSSLSKGMAVTIDKRDGQFMCVRPTGGLDCFWVSAVAINQNPTEPEKAQSSRPGGQGRGGGHRPPLS